MYVCVCVCVCVYKDGTKQLLYLSDHLNYFVLNQFFDYFKITKFVISASVLDIILKLSKSFL